MLMFLVSRFLLLVAALTITNVLALNRPPVESFTGFYGGDWWLESVKYGFFRSKGKSSYAFLDYITYADHYTCASDDIWLPGQRYRNARLSYKLTCVQDDEKAGSLHMIENIRELALLLKPVDATVKPSKAGGRCALVYFYTENCYGCALVAPYINFLPYQFPKLRIAAVDAFKFPQLSRRFDILQVPTLVMFYERRAIMKFYAEAGSFAGFVTRHTNIKPVKKMPPFYTITGPLSVELVEQTDYYLLLAWAFILCCAGYYLGYKTELGSQIGGVVKRNFRKRLLMKFK